jgi:hypothetical protein
MTLGMKQSAKIAVSSDAAGVFCVIRAWFLLSHFHFLSLDDDLELKVERVARGARFAWSILHSYIDEHYSAALFFKSERELIGPLN